MAAVETAVAMAVVVLLPVLVELVELAVVLVVLVVHDGHALAAVMVPAPHSPRLRIHLHLRLAAALEHGCHEAHDVHGPVVVEVVVVLVVVSSGHRLPGPHRSCSTLPAACRRRRRSILLHHSEVHPMSSRHRRG